MTADRETRRRQLVAVDDWPLGEWLPLTNERSQDIGFVTRKSVFFASGPVIYLGPVGSEVRPDTPTIRFRSIDALLDGGWVAHQP